MRLLEEIGILKKVPTYEEIVKNYFLTQRSSNIYAGAPGHLTTVFENIFKNVKKELLLICNEDHLNLFLDLKYEISSDVEKKVLVDSKESLSSFKEIFGTNVNYIPKKCTFNISDVILDNNFSFPKYFTVGDGKSYLVENPLKWRHRCLASANDIKTGEVLREIFFELWKKIN